MSEQVLFADVELSVHKPYGNEIKQEDGTTFVNVTSEILLPGQYVALSALPSYQREAVLQGKVAGARVMNKEDADLLVEQAARLRGEVPEVDNSHSDYVVSDEDRVKQHAGLAETNSEEEEEVTESEVDPWVPPVSPELSEEDGEPGVLPKPPVDPEYQFGESTVTTDEEVKPTRRTKK